MIKIFRVLFISLLLLSISLKVQSAEEVTGWAAGDVPIIVKGGILVDVTNGELIQNSSIVINGDVIESIGENNRPDGAIEIDASGKFIIPGLIDLHVHYKDWSGPLYLNHGVTTAISLGDTYDWIRAQKMGIKRGLIVGPRLFISTENLDKTPENLDNYFVRPHVRLFNNAEDASEGMRQYLVEKVDAVKVYDGLTESELVAIIEEAEKEDIPVIGHFKDVRVAANLGAHGIEHTAAVANVLLDTEAQAIAMRKVRKGLVIPNESFMDVSKLPELVEMMVENDLYLNPTFRMGWQPDRELRERGFHYEDFDLTFNDWRLRFIPIGWRLANLKEYQEIGLWNFRDLTQFERDLFHQGFINVQRLVKEYENAGGKLYTGTDSANMAIPGLSIHQEMELFVAAGVSPLTALQASTINPAELMRMNSRLGTIKEGKVGDLVILDANPLEDIRNTRKINLVISRGKVLDGEYDPNYTNPIPKTTPFQSSHFFPSPRIRTITPGTLYLENEETTLTITGTGFIPYSFVRWNESKLETEFVSEYELRVDIPDSFLKEVGTYSITIENPDFAYGSVYAKGASDIVHMGVRDNISNEINVMVVWP